VAAEHISQGSLFSTDFLRESIERIPDWQLLTDAEIDALAADLRAIFSQFPTAQRPPPNEAQTEDDLIWPILVRLGWTASLRQQNLAAKGRDDVPDGLLFKDAATRRKQTPFLKNGGATVAALRLLNPNGGNVHSIASPAEAAKKPPRRPRCFAICAAWTTSQPANSVGAC
jgi:hypothetical protein